MAWNNSDRVFAEISAWFSAWKADTFDNLIYRMTEQNFNKAIATADLVIAEVKEIVPAGEIAPDAIHTTGCRGFPSRAQTEGREPDLQQ